MKQTRKWFSQYVTCKICGRNDLRIVSGKHLQTHGWTREEYLKEYNLSDDQLICDDTRIIQSKLQTFYPYSKSELKQKIRSIYKTHKKADHTFVKENYFIVYRQACWLFGTWDEALKMSGLKANLIRRTEKWTSEKVLKVIRKRFKGGLSLTGRKFYKTNLALVSAADLYFGTWRNAIKASGLQEDDVGLKHAWSKSRIIREIRSLGTIDKADKHYRTMLGKAAKRKFGSLKIAVEKAGFDPEKFYGKTFWDKEKVISAILERHKNGKALSAKAVKKEDPKLNFAVHDNFGSWFKALSAAKIDPNSVALQQYWSKDRIISELRQLAKAGYPAWTYKFLKDNHLALLSASQRHFSGLKEAVRVAKIKKQKAD